MKTSLIYLLLVGILVVWASGAWADAITVTSPNGGEQWANGGPMQTRNITWTYSGDPSGKQVKILLLKGGAILGEIVPQTSPVPPTPGIYPWKVGDYFGGSAPLGSDYRIKVKVIGMPIGDESNADFSIKAFLQIRPEIYRQLKPEIYKGPLQVMPLKKPDLRVTVRTNPEHPNLSQTTAFILDIVNQGEGASSGNPMWRLYLDANGSWTGEYWEGYAGSFSAGQTRSITAKSNYSFMTGSTAVWSLRGDVDKVPSGGVVDESNEANNAHTLTIGTVP